MPSKTQKQAKFFAICAHHPEAARGKCPPPAVSREFNQADKGTGILRGKRKKRASRLARYAP